MDTLENEAWLDTNGSITNVLQTDGKYVNLWRVVLIWLLAVTRPSLWVLNLFRAPTWLVSMHSMLAYYIISTLFQNFWYLSYNQYITPFSFHVFFPNYMFKSQMRQALTPLKGTQFSLRSLIVLDLCSSSHFLTVCNDILLYIILYTAVFTGCRI